MALERRLEVQHYDFVTARCEVGAIQRLFFLDSTFQPGMGVPVRFSPIQLAFGEVVEIPVGSRQ